MSEAIWIELIKVLPAFLWVGLGIAGLVVAKRLLTQQAHRMTRVESPFVSVDFAQEAIAEASRRGAPVIEPPPWEQASPYQAPGYSVGGYGPGTVPGGYPGGGTFHSDNGSHGLGDEQPQAETEPSRSARPGEASPPKPEAVPLDDTEPEAPQDTEDPVPVTGAGAGASQYATVPPRHYLEAPPSNYQAPLSNPWPYGAITGTSGVPQQFGGARNLPEPESYPQARVGSEHGLTAAKRLANATDLLQGGSILWVDDHPERNESLVRLFRTAGMRVDTALTTEEAMRALAVDEYDLVISDLKRTTEQAGPYAGEVLLHDLTGAGHRVPVIVYTTAAKARTAANPRAAAVTGYPEDVVNYVVDLVGYRRHRGSGSLSGKGFGHR